MFKQPFIWMQSSSAMEAGWVSTAECVWDGPPWLKSKQRLKPENYAELEIFFKVALQIPDASNTDIASDLIMLKSQTDLRVDLNSQSSPGDQSNIGSTGPSSHVKRAAEGTNRVSNIKDKAFAGFGADRIIEEAEKRYNYLWNHLSMLVGQGEDVWTPLRSTFEQSALVYVPKDNAWFPPSQCVWVASSIKIPSKASIAGTFSTEKTFFTTALKVSEPTVEMYIESLKAEAAGTPSASRVKATMALISGLDIGESDFSSLLEVPFLPVKLPRGSIIFTSTSPRELSKDFAIVDNVNHSNAFERRIAILDFTLEEIRDTRPLLLALRLEKRFTSNLVKEVTEVKDGSQDYEMTNKLRMKSQYITR